ncbi:MAG: hypothetical protein IJ736_04950, partial [Firmicutes bacterium]|nr:hypothetical protein [Bacillota bacterium]
APFEDEASANLMHRRTAEHYGHAGKCFIEKLISADEEEICRLYEKMSEHINRQSRGKSGSHAASIAAAALADALAGYWIWSGGSGTDIPADIWERAEKMADSVLMQQLTADEADVNENAAGYIVDWIMSNQIYFGAKAYGTCYGFLNGNKAYIFPSILTEVLKKGGFSPRKTMRYLADKGIIAAKNNGNHMVYSVTKHFIDRNCRFVEFDMREYAEEKDPLFYEEEISGEDDEELPF